MVGGGGGGAFVHLAGNNRIRKWSVAVWSFILCLDDLRKSRGQEMHENEAERGVCFVCLFVLGWGG